MNNWERNTAICILLSTSCPRSCSLPNNRCPAIINSDARAVDLTSTLSICHVHTEPSNLIHIDVGSLNGIEDIYHLLITLHMHPIAKRISNVGFHATHHQSVALDALVAVVRSSILSQSDKTVLAGSIGST